MPETHTSEVARFREQQALEEEAARLALSGYAISARHDFINARMQRGGERILQLIEQGKHEEAQVLMNSENWGVEEAVPQRKAKGRKKQSHA
ncbi:MAG TPA: hypothetical protein VFQ36_13895 [Ktedonobacteraceae bacterium]|nr:hypothetical protein [Ktedonobacteraceae bacterium]